jgi:AcrR family transcriptional regulator
MTADTLSKRERTRLSILDAAYNFFITQGFHGTSMRQIAQAAGFALGSTYNHFGSKEDIFVAILLERHPYHYIMPALQSAVGKTAEEFVKNAAQTLVTELGQHPEVFNLLLIEIVEFKGAHIPLIFKDVFPNVMKIAQKVSAFQGLRPIPLPLLMRAFLATFFAYYLSEILLVNAPIPELHENSLEGFIDIFLHGIVKPVT